MHLKFIRDFGNRILVYGILEYGIPEYGIFENGILETGFSNAGLRTQPLFLNKIIHNLSHLYSHWTIDLIKANDTHSKNLLKTSTFSTCSYNQFSIYRKIFLQWTNL